MIAIFDEDGGGDVDFQEFVSGLSAFSSKGNKEEKLHFAFKVYDIDRDGYISNGELFIVLKMMVGSNLKDMQLQQIVDKTIMEADKDRDGKISFEEFANMVENTDVTLSMTLGKLSSQSTALNQMIERSSGPNTERYFSPVGINIIINPLTARYQLLLYFATNMHNRPVLMTTTSFFNLQKQPFQLSTALLCAFARAPSSFCMADTLNMHPNFTYCGDSCGFYAS